MFLSLLWYSRQNSFHISNARFSPFAIRNELVHSGFILGDVRAFHVQKFKWHFPGNNWWLFIKILIYGVQTTPHDSGGVLWFHVGHLLRQSICLPYIFSFPGGQKLGYVSGVSRNLIYALTLRRASLGLIVGKLSPIFDSVIISPTWHTSVFSFPHDNLNKYQEMFTKRGICIDNAEIWFGIDNGQT